MPWQINKEILDRTTKCPRDFMCLAEGKCPHCEIEEALKGNGAFIAGGTERTTALPHQARDLLALRKVEASNPA